MSYIGRAGFAGIDVEALPFSAYAISGRSAFSQKRRFELFPEEGRVYVGSIGELTDDQKRYADMIFYNCMRTRDRLLFVTNGAQTDVRLKDGREVPSFYHNTGTSPSLQECFDIVNCWGYEPDKPIFTPRTAIVNNPLTDATFSIAARQSDDDEQVYARAIRVGMNGKGQARGLATYKGHESQALPWRGTDFPGLHDDKLLLAANFSGRTAEELTEEMYAFMDPKFVVAAVAAVWKDGRWQIAEPKNRFRDETEFKAYADSLRK